MPWRQVGAETSEPVTAPDPARQLQSWSMDVGLLEVCTADITFWVCICNIWRAALRGVHRRASSALLLSQGSPLLQRRMSHGLPPVSSGRACDTGFPSRTEYVHISAPRSERRRLESTRGKARAAVRETPVGVTTVCADIASARLLCLTEDSPVEKISRIVAFARCRETTYKSALLCCCTTSGVPGMSMFVRSCPINSLDISQVLRT